MSSSVIAQRILFSTKLAELADISKSGDVLTVRRPYRFLGLIPLSRVDCTLRIARRNNHWGVMLTPQYGPPEGFVGAEFARGVDADADALFISAWRYIKKQWTRVAQPGESEIRRRVEDAVNRAFEQHCEE